MGYKVIGMMKVSGLDKDLKSGVAVPYMSASERASYLVTVQSGRIMWKT